MGKIYAVAAGRQTGLFDSWAECSRMVTGYKGAKFKSFTNKEDALAYLDSSKTSSDIDAELTAYVDGSYNMRTGVFAYGAVIIGADGEQTFSGSFSDPELSSMRNVAGEIAGSRFAIGYAIEHNAKSIAIYYDYQGISSWATGEWRCNLDATRAYRDYYAEASKKLDIYFVKVKGHSGDKYNDMADALAKQAAGIK